MSPDSRTTIFDKGKAKGATRNRKEKNTDKRTSTHPHEPHVQTGKEIPHTGAHHHLLTLFKLSCPQLPHIKLIPVTPPDHTETRLLPNTT